jgi:hypothetical protein
MNGDRPIYSEKTHTDCPRCASSRIRILPTVNPGSSQEWFECGGCGHMWSQRRDRTEQGEPPEQGRMQVADKA